MHPQGQGLKLERSPNGPEIPPPYFRIFYFEPYSDKGVHATKCKVQHPNQWNDCLDESLFKAQNVQRALANLTDTERELKCVGLAETLKLS